MTKYYSRSKGKFIDIANMPDQYVRNAFVKMCSTDENCLHEINQNRFELQKQVKHYKKLAEDNFASSVADLDSIEKLIKQNNELQGMYDKLKDTTYQPYDNQGRVRDYQVEYSKVAKERDSYKKKANDMEMAKMNINRELLDAKDKLKDTVSKCNNQLANAMPLESWKKINDECRKLQLENVRLVQQLEHDETVVSKQAYQIMWDNCQKLKEEVRLLRGSREMAYDRIKSFMPKGDVKMFSEIPNTDDGWEFVRLLKKYLNNVSYKLRVRGQYLDDETKKTEGWQRYSWGQPIEKSKCLRVYVDINNG